MPLVKSGTKVSTEKSKAKPVAKAKEVEKAIKPSTPKATLKAAGKPAPVSKAKPAAKKAPVKLLKISDLPTTTAQAVDDRKVETPLLKVETPKQTSTKSGLLNIKDVFAKINPPTANSFVNKFVTRK